MTNEVSLVFAVCDTGAGIALENQSKIFKEIVQFNPSELQNGGGSGLGLWISGGIVSMHGGSVDLSSQGEGKGSTFSFTIPAAERNRNELQEDPSQANENRELIDDASAAEGTIATGTIPEGTIGTNIIDPDEQSVQPSADSANMSNTVSRSSSKVIRDHAGVEVGGTEILGGSPVINSRNLHQPRDKYFRVLIVDDSALNRKMLVRILTAQGYDVVEAGNGDDAIDICNKFLQSMLVGLEPDEEPFLAIFLDNHMPGRSGPSTCRVIRQLGYKRLILGTTGDASDKVKCDFISAGANEVMIKPINISLILKVLKTEELKAVSKK